MKKLLFLLLFFAFLLPFTPAQTTPTVYCKASLQAVFGQDYLQESGLSIEQVSESSDCVCWQSQPQFSAWRSQYCQSGQLLMQRDVFNLLPPQCSSYEKIVEKQLFEDERCAICPNPIIKSDWGLVGCYSNGRVEARSITAYLFDTKGECQAKQMVELRNVEGQCSFNDVVNSLDFWLYGAGLGIIIVLAIVIYWKWIK